MIPDVRVGMGREDGGMNNEQQRSNVKKLRRSSSDKMVAGVCGGWAAMFGVDSTILRLLFVAATIFGIGTPILIYIACWFLMPWDHVD